MNDPDGGPEGTPLAPVLRAAGRFGAKPAAPGPQPVDPGRRAAVGDFLGDLAHTLAARGGAEVDALLERSEHARRRALRDRPALRTREAATELLARCRAAWPGDPGGAVEAARLACRLLAEPGSEAEWAPGDRASLSEAAREHLAAAERIARRAEEIDRRRSRTPPPAEDPAAYPQGTFALSEVAEDALAVEIEAALDDLRDASFSRGRTGEAALAVLDRARLALARGGPRALADFARAAADRFADPRLPPVPREVLRHLAAAAADGSADLALLKRLTRILLAAGVGFSD